MDAKDCCGAGKVHRRGAESAEGRRGRFLTTKARRPQRFWFRRVKRYQDWLCALGVSVVRFFCVLCDPLRSLRLCGENSYPRKHGIAVRFPLSEQVFRRLLDVLVAAAGEVGDDDVVFRQGGGDLGDVFLGSGASSQHFSCRVTGGVVESRHAESVAPPISWSDLSCDGPWGWRKSCFRGR